MVIASAGKNITDSAQINPGVIVNSDVSDTAAIAGSKIQVLVKDTNAGVIPSTGIVDAHIAAGAAIARSKIAAGTQGGILYSGAAGALSELAAGNSGQVLKSGGAGANPSWGGVGTALSQDGTGASYTGGTGEQTLKTYTIPGGTMGTNTLLKVTFFLRKSGGNNSATFKIKYGGTTILTMAGVNDDIDASGMNLVLYIASKNSVSSQRCTAMFVNPITGVLGTELMGAGVNTTVNSASNADVVLTGQLVNAADTVGFYYMTAELVTT